MPSHSHSAERSPRPRFEAHHDQRARVVVIAGASSGIGRACALACASAGADLVLAARSRESLERVAHACERRGALTLVVTTDVTDAAACTHLAQAAIDRFGGFDVWINVVGVGAVGLFEKTPIDAHRRVIESNLIGQMNGAHVALSQFKRQEHGTLINMISIGGWVPAPYAAAYSASKFGLRGFSEAVRAEVAGWPDIHVCTVNPTFVDTPGIANGANYTGRRLKPPPPLLNPRTVADAVVSLIEHPRPTVFVGNTVALPARIAHAVAPDLVGAVTKWVFGQALRRADRIGSTDGNLFDPSNATRIDGGYRVEGRSRWAASAAAASLFALGWWMARRGTVR